MNPSSTARSTSRRRARLTWTGALRALHLGHPGPGAQFHLGPHLSQRHHQERRGDYLGGTVQVIPPHHRRKSSRPSWPWPPRRMWPSSRIGGTVGDIESLPFMEPSASSRGPGQKKTSVTSPDPGAFIKSAGEVKTKPTQHSVKNCAPSASSRISFCAAPKSLSPDIKAKISLFCNVEPETVITRPGCGQHLRDSLLFHRGGIG